jgi:hypothetical protein
MFEKRMALRFTVSKAIVSTSVDPFITQMT